MGSNELIKKHVSKNWGEQKFRSVQAGLVLHQQYVPEKVEQIEIMHTEQKFPFKTVLWFGGIDNLILYSVWLYH